jgi:CRP-like cAMP-binding protein
MLAAARTYAAQVPATLRGVFANHELRRVELAFAGFNAAEWAVWIAMIVYAYERGGATTAGLVALAQLVPAALFAPFASTLADRRRAGRVLLWGYVAQAVAMGATAVALLADGPPPVAYALAACAATAVTVTRPAQAALVPSLVRRPRELTAVNVVSGWIESSSVLAAPALAGVLLDVSGPGSVFGVMSGVALVSALLVAPVPGPAPAGGGAATVVLSGPADALDALRSEPEPRALFAVLGAQFVAIGALDILFAALAISELELAGGWAGYLNAAFGLGGVLAIAVTAALVGRRQLAPSLLAAVGVWLAAFGILGLRPTVAAAVVLIGLGGAARAVLDVSGRTLLQRLAPGDLLARVFGVLESVNMAALAVGSLLAPALVALGGVRLALVGVGALPALAALLVGRSVRRADRRADVPVVELGLLRALPLFASLPAPELEALARALVPVEAPVGAVVVAEGSSGERFYVVADGEIEVSENGRVVGLLRRGDGFGEIALLHDVPRTATCRAASSASLYALERGDFLAALTAHPVARAEAGRLAAERLSRRDGARRSP